MSKNSAQYSKQYGIGIEKFLVGKSFFVTGATGFLAKVLIEKILRTAPEVGKIFLLIKAESEEAASKRLKDEVINAELFKCLQQTYGECYQDFMLNKLVPVVGNISESNLGLEGDLAKVIANEVDVIINSAANTTLHERYDIAIDINTRGPSHVMNFAKKCKKIKVFVHMSTGKCLKPIMFAAVSKNLSYVNGKRQGRIMEKPFYMGDTIARELNFNNSKIEPKLDVEKEIELAMKSKKALENDEDARKKMKELGLERARKYGWDVTYVFTKAMGEMMIDTLKENIPVVIIRPSMIQSTYKEPFAGWIQGNGILDLMILYYGRGQLNEFVGDPSGILDVVPVDMVVNATLAAIAKHGQVVIQKPEVKVYQIASSVTNPLVTKYLLSLLHEHFDSSPFLDSKGSPIRVPLMKLFTSMEDFSAHLLDGAMQRSIIGSSNGELLAQKQYEILRRKEFANVYLPYGFYAGRFDCSNTLGLMQIMNEEEKKKFGFDMGSIDWKHYITNVHVPGLRRHVMKEKRGETLVGAGNKIPGGPKFYKSKL
ncbi:Fatty acyl-CoA reductase 2 [Citrus sinensis]|uniref:Fatty acyl-CoA reductase 2 n=2 Tax=Citrus sinensis TaxID=2711 RepID=A0ACB8JYF4_CITSI|nr:Fatty acyl-CoA reductase 2 [Citrus sinensis]